MTDWSESVVCSRVPRVALKATWRHAGPLLMKAKHTANGVMDEQDLFDEIDFGRMALWVVFKGEDVIAAFTTRVSQFPKIRVMHVDWVGGSKMKEWIDLALSEIVKHAKDEECARIEATGRGAWLRWVGNRGWSQMHITYGMEV
jgi:hypothetical protein